MPGTAAARLGMFSVVMGHVLYEMLAHRLPPNFMKTVREQYAVCSNKRWKQQYASLMSHDLITLHIQSRSVECERCLILLFATSLAVREGHSCIQEMCIL